MPARRFVAACCLALAGLGVSPGADGGRVTIKCWDKRTGFEADAMRAGVDDFNASQNRIWTGEATAEEALDEVQRRQQKTAQRRTERRQRNEPALRKLWGDR